jgi:cyclin-dependent kinase 7
VHRNGKIYLVLEYMDSDLETIINATDAIPHLEVAHIKGYLHMLLRAVQELHDRKILHRDIKPNNLLVAKHGRVAKLTDFGMATQVSGTDTKSLSIQVVTRAYRAPELFFGKDQYGSEVDMWSVGCIFAEMVLRRTFLDGSSDIDQLSHIFSALGSPSENGWHAAAELPFHLTFKPTNPKPLKDQFPELSEAGVDLLGKFLQVDPSKRISAADALQHAFFSEEPLPATGEELPIVLPVDSTKKRPLAEVLADVADGRVEEEGEADGEGGRVAIKGRRIL